MRELMSFSHLEYCAGKMHPTIVWQPGVKGVVALLAQRADCDQRAAELEVKPIGNGLSVLLWSFSDPIHPQYVLEAPADVLAFRFHPTRPATVIGGLSDGTIVVWNLTQAKFEWEKARSLQTMKSSRAPRTRSPPSRWRSRRRPLAQARGD